MVEPTLMQMKDELIKHQKEMIGLMDGVVKLQKSMIEDYKKLLNR